MPRLLKGNMLNVDRVVEFLKYFITWEGSVRFDGLVLYTLGTLYYLYIHRKHDDEMVRGFKGSNGMWEPPEAVVYYWLQSFPFILFADGFLKLRLSDGMMLVFTLILLFAIMGRAGVELLLAMKTKITNGVVRNLDQPEKKDETST